jgi:hypothetical protein
MMNRCNTWQGPLKYVIPLMSVVDSDKSSTLLSFTYVCYGFRQELLPSLFYLCLLWIQTRAPPFSLLPGPRQHHVLPFHDVAQGKIEKGAKRGEGGKPLLSKHRGASIVVL